MRNGGILCLADIGLSADITPAITAEGGGSSFTGLNAAPSSEALSNRFKMTEPRQPWQRFLSHVRTEHPDVLDSYERALFDAFLS